MLRRSDVDYYLKTPANVQPGNDQIAFYSEVPGYYPSTGAQSPISLVSYRINAQFRTERLGKGLLWNGVSPGSTPLAFLPLNHCSFLAGGHKRHRRFRLRDRSRPRFSP